MVRKLYNPKNKKTYIYKDKPEKPVENDPTAIYGDITPQAPKGLTPVSPAGDVFIDEEGIVWTLELNVFSGCRELLKQMGVKPRTQ